jgi:hypothetical protein
MRSITRGLTLASTGIILLVGCRIKSVEQGAQERFDGPLGASEYFVRQRAFPGKMIPAGARLAAFNDVRRRWPNAFRSIEKGQRANMSVVGAQWTFAGPAPLIGGSSQTSGNFDNSGRALAIAVHPTNSQIVYVGTASGGVWKTTNGGTSWTPITDSECALATGAITLSPADPSVIFVGTGEDNFSLDSYQGCGVLRSTDGGTTWQQMGASTFVLSSGGAARVAKIVVLPGATSVATTTVIAATTFGLYRSTDGGSTWAVLPTATGFATGTWTDLVLDPSNPPTPTVYGAQSSTGVWKYVNGGTVTKVSTGLPTSGFNRISLAAAPSSANTFFVALNNSSTNELLGIYKTINAGSNWTNVFGSSTTMCAVQCWYDMVVAVDPANTNNVFFSGFDIYKSTNGGGAFSPVGSTIHVDQHALVFDPQNTQTMYAASDGGVFKSTNGGTTWTGLNTNIGSVQIYPGMSIHPTSSTTFLAGLQDNGSVEGGASLPWPAVRGGDGAATMYAPDGTAYVEFQAGVAAPLRRDPPSTGTSGWNFKGPSTSTETAWWVRPMAMDEHNSKVIYFGTTKLYRSDNKGDSWAQLSNDLTTSSVTLRGITTIALSPSDSATIYLGTSDANVWVTSDLGTTWTNISAGLPPRAITKIVVDPLDPKTAWVGLSGYSTSNPGHIFKTVNRGASWTNISGSAAGALPNVPVNAIALHRGSRELFIGTDIGVYSMVDGGTSWTPVMAGLPSVPVVDIVFDGQRGRLVAGTHGRGLWTLAVTEAVLRGDVTKNGTVQADDAQAILNSIVGAALPAGGVKFPYGDANCDGNVTAVDALLVLTKVAGGSTGTACVGTIK